MNEPLLYIRLPIMSGGDAQSEYRELAECMVDKIHFCHRDKEEIQQAGVNVRLLVFCVLAAYISVFIWVFFGSIWNSVLLWCMTQMIFFVLVLSCLVCSVLCSALLLDARFGVQFFPWHSVHSLYKLRSRPTPLTNLWPRLTRGCTDLPADCCTSMNEVVQY